ncbi:polymer-forming cytoskeletal protein [Halosimplex pelagicum]|uniref:Polymer-forming cytoskeletal protein n=1 Tax=Halosimplex pelagicum TaxID=869886 RepID=A0A7D5TEC3_9EURY|nr:polymer-forming cytoskeletal protein [Halosimplex pelagicum]QLH84529.1 polymer-forming cytoskeletal protein [Halosimplex pelagicum]
MPIRSDPLDELTIPDGTTVEEHDLVTDGDVIVGGQSTVEFGVRGDDVMAGERVTFDGHIEAEGDCRLDMWSEVEADVLVGGDAYLGERTRVGGELKVAGNVDIGDDVDIEESFEASGHIVIRNPMPTVVFLVVYLSQLLRIGEEEAAEDLASQLVDAEDDEAQPVVIPRGARVSDDAWRVSTPATVGDDCRLHGNIRAESLDVGSDNTVFGSLRARGDVTVGPDTEIKGDVTTRGGDVSVAKGATVWGDISAEDVALHEHAVVEGKIRVSGELTQVRDALGPDPADGGTDPDGDDEAAADTGDGSTDDADSEAPDSAESADGETAEPAGDEGEEPAATDGTETDAGDADEPVDEPAGESADDPPAVESREAVESELDGVVPMMGAEPDHSENGHDDDAEIAPDAD